MKLSFKFSVLILTLLLSTVLNARMINIYSLDKSRAQYIVEIFINDYDIPSELIRTVKNDCTVQKMDKRMLNLCINKKGELKLLSPNIDLIKKSLSTFKTP